MILEISAQLLLNEKQKPQTVRSVGFSRNENTFSLALYEISKIVSAPDNQSPPVSSL